MTVTATQPPAPPTDETGHPPASVLFRAHLHRHRLDRELAADAEPIDTALLLQRERELLSRRHRARLAGVLERTLKEAEGPAQPFSSKSPLARAAIRECHAEITTLIARLDSDQAPAPRGMARITLLLRNGHSPLYAPETSGEELRRVLAAASQGRHRAS